MFFLIGLIGALLLGLSQFFGDHHDVSHDFDSTISDDHGGGPSPFSLRTISIFLLLFGAAGWLAGYYGMPAGEASAVGIGAGLLAGAVSYGFLRLMWSQQAESTASVAEMLGQRAEVTSAIPADDVGEITIVFKGQRRTFLARSRNRLPIEAGRAVRILEDQGASVLVEGPLAWEGQADKGQADKARQVGGSR